ncbi:hypothetical protein NDU88_004140 [Pleurodeles waltl]|uniref:Uncharacterized protein n=1 Tax=Pleurodeles waltl TaxID=8319 RepID=A0AAV7LJ07_PLEWA|nr:hypothetical protein NDU88_004140 [Pleurodeles waltl]
MQGLLTPRGDAEKSSVRRMKSQGLRRSGGCCVGVSVAQLVLRRSSMQDVGLRSSGSAMRQSGGLCGKVLVATLALHRSPLRELGCVVPGRRCVDSTSEEEEFPPCAEPTPEELEADTAELLGEGGPAREELSVAQHTCPTLEGLRQQAVKQANGDVSDSHRVYWEDNLLYTEARDPKPGAARRLVIPQE